MYLNGFMFCTKCGKEYSEGERFCTGCGNNLMSDVQENAQPEVMVEQPVQQYVQPEVMEDAGATTVLDQSMLEQTPIATQVAEQPLENATMGNAQWENQPTGDAVFDFANNVEPETPKKKKKWLKIALFTLLPLVLVGAIVALNFSFIAGHTIKLFGSDSDYMMYAEGQSLSKLATAITDGYDLILGNESNALTEKNSFNSEVKLVIGDEAKNLLKQYAGDIDLDWLTNASFKMSGNINDKLISLVLGADLNGTEIVSAEYIVDTLNYKAYFTVKDLIDKYIGISLDEPIFNYNNVTENAEASLETLYPMSAKATTNSAAAVSDLIDPELIEKVKEIIPDGDTLNDLIEKYLKVALGAVDEAKAK